MTEEGRIMRDRLTKVYTNMLIEGKDHQGEKIVELFNILK